MLIANNTIMIASKNQGKVQEFRHFFARYGAEVRSLADEPNIPEVIEDGQTFHENALKKAVAIAEHLHIPVLADDSGLCVDRLDGAPGVFSARYAGEHATDEMNNEKLLNALLKQSRADEQGLLSPASFVCVLVLYDPASKQAIEAEGRCNGQITAFARGKHGFGYDPVFYLPSFGKTMAEISAEQKNQVSHRGEALRKLTVKLDEMQA